MENVRALESGRKVTQALQDAAYQRLRESIRESYKGLDIADKSVFDFQSPLFSFTKLREAVYGYCHKIREANAEGALGALLRAGVQSIVNGQYEAVPPDIDQIAQVVVSDKAIELYAPLYRAGFPRRVERQEEFPDQKVAGADFQIMNEKFGGLLTFTREMFEDDQTSQLSQKAAQFGENMKLVEAAWIAQRFIGTAGTFAGDTIPKSQTTPNGETSGTTWPWATSFGNGKGQNRLTTYSAFSSTNIQAMDILAMNMLDPLGNKMLVSPDTLVAGPGLKWPVMTLLNSAFYPSTTAMSAAVSGGSSTGIGTNYAQNVLKGIYSPVISRFLPNTAYGIGQAGKGLILQRRTSLEVIQENPATGAAFTADVFRYKIRSRFEPDWIEPRFWVLGNDGSVS